MSENSGHVDFPATIDAIRNDIGVLSEAFGMPSRKGRQFKRLTLQPQTNSRLMAQAQQARDTPGQVTTVRGNGLAMEYFTAKVDRRFVSGHLGIDSSSVGSLFGKTLSAVVYGHGRTAQALAATQSSSFPAEGGSSERSAKVVAGTRPSRRKLQQPNDGTYPSCHRLLPLPSLRKFDAEQPSLAFKGVARPKLLIVDSNMIHLAACKAIFDRHFEIVHAVSMAEQALELLEHLHFDLALIAADLPGYMSGVDLSDAIRRIEAVARTRMLIVGMLTREQAADQGVIDACFIGGMDRFVLKPAILVSSLLKTLLTGGSSVDVFRRLTLETQWFSQRGRVKDVLAGSADQVANAQLFALSTGTEETLQNAVAAEITDPEVQGAVVDLHKRQQREEYTTVMAATFHLRERIEQLEHEAHGLRSQLAFRKAADESKLQSLLGVESRLTALEKSLHEKSLLAQTQKDLADRYREDLRTMIRDGSANAEKVAKAIEHATKMRQAAEAAERQAMGAQDSVAWRAWYNYYGDEKLRSARHDYVPKKAKDVTASYYRDHLLHLLAAMKKQRMHVAKAVDVSCATMRKFSISKEASSQQNVANVVESQTHAMQENVGEELSTMEDHVDAVVANIMVRELDFWRMLENDEPRLRDELAKLRAALTSWRSENHPVECSSQTDGSFQEYVGPGGGLLSADRLLQAEQSAQLALLTRYLPFFTDERYLSPAAKMATFEELFDAMHAIESKDRQRVFEATKEVQTEVWKIAKRVSDPERTVKLMAPLSRLNQQSFTAVVATLQNISENLDLLFGLAIRSAPQSSKVMEPPPERKAPAGARLSLDGAKKAMMPPKKEPPVLQRSNSMRTDSIASLKSAPLPTISSGTPSIVSDMNGSPAMQPSNHSIGFDQSPQHSCSVTPTIEKKISDLAPTAEVRSPRLNLRPTPVPEPVEATKSPAPPKHEKTQTPPPATVAVAVKPSASPRSSAGTKAPIKQAPPTTPPPAPLFSPAPVTATEVSPPNSNNNTVCAPPLRPSPQVSPMDYALPIAQATSLFEPEEPELPAPAPNPPEKLHTSISSLPPIGSPVSVSKSPRVQPPPPTVDRPEPAPLNIQQQDTVPAVVPTSSRKVSFKRSPPQQEVHQPIQASEPPPKPQSRSNSLRHNSPPMEKKKSVVIQPAPAPPDATLKLVEIAFAEKTEPGNMRHSSTAPRQGSVSGKETVAKQKHLEQLFGTTSPPTAPVTNVAVTTAEGRLPSRQSGASASVFGLQDVAPQPTGGSNSSAAFDSLVQRRRSEKANDVTETPAKPSSDGHNATTIRTMSFTQSVREKRQSVKSSGHVGEQHVAGDTKEAPREDPLDSSTAGYQRQEAHVLKHETVGNGVGGGKLIVSAHGSGGVAPAPPRHTAKDVDDAMASSFQQASKSIMQAPMAVSEEGGNVVALSEPGTGDLAGTSRSGHIEQPGQTDLSFSIQEPALKVVALNARRDEPEMKKDEVQPGDLVDASLPDEMEDVTVENPPEAQVRDRSLSAVVPNGNGSALDKKRITTSAPNSSFPLAPVASVPFSVRSSVLPIGQHISSSAPGAISPPPIQMPMPLSPSLPKLTAEDFPAPPFPWPKPRSSRLLPSSESARPPPK